MSDSDDAFCSGCGARHRLSALYRGAWCPDCAPGAETIDRLLSDLGPSGPDSDLVALRLLYAARVTLEQQTARLARDALAAGHPWHVLADVLHAPTDDLHRRWESPADTTPKVS